MSLAEALLLGWRHFGHDLFERLDGDFAIAIDDAPARRLILARDALGQRALHFRRSRDHIWFATFARSLAASAGDIRPDLTQLVRHISRLPQDPSRSWFEGVEKVPPGSFIEFDPTGRSRLRRWWVPDLTPVRCSHAAAVELVGTAVERAVSLVLDGENEPIGAQLSGGLDSSLVVAAASRQARRQGRSLIAITADFAERADAPGSGWFADEGDVASATAASLGNVDHRIVHPDASSPIADIDDWMPSLDLPIRNACNLGWVSATYRTAVAAGASRLLTGVSGNHGISHAGGGRLAQLARSLDLVGVRRESAALRAAGSSWAGIAALAIGPYVPRPLWHLVRGGSPGLSDTMLRKGNPIVEEARADLRRRRLWGDSRPPRPEPPEDRLALLQSDDFGPLNASTRRRFGLTLFDPLGSRGVLETVFRLPSEHLYRDGISRRLARSLLLSWVDTPAATRTDRGYQGGQWRSGFEADRPRMIEEIDAIDRDPGLRSVLDSKRMRDLVEQWPAAGWTDARQVTLYRSHLMTALSAARWARQVREGRWVA